MDISEQLAAYAAGELAPDERTALEATLAGDAGLRQQLLAIRRMDAMLAGLDPAEPSAAFSSRLRATLREELGATSTAVGGEVMSLDAARARSAQRRQQLLKPLGMVAAAAAMVAVVGVGMNSLGSSDDESIPMSSMEAAAPEAADMFDPAGSDAQARASSAQPVYAEGGSYDQDTLAGLGDRGDIQALLRDAAIEPFAAQSRNLDALVSSRFGGGFAAGSGPAPENDGMSDAGSQDSAATAGTSAQAPQGIAGDDVDPVLACLPDLLEASDRVPLFLDVGTYNDAPALITVLGSRNAQGDFERLEFWVLDPNDDCRVVHFSQQG